MKGWIAVILAVGALFGAIGFNVWIALKDDGLTQQERRGAYLQSRLFYLHPAKRTDVTCFVLDLPKDQGGPSFSCTKDFR
jgi:hypothetical protein